MGRNKLLLRVEGESLVRRIARRALAAGLDPVVVVLGRDAEDAERELADLPLSIVVNTEHEAGIHTSRRAGLAAVPSDRDAAIVLLADMPFVTEQMLAALVARYREYRRPTRLFRLRRGIGAAKPLRPVALRGAGRAAGGGPGRTSGANARPRRGGDALAGGRHRRSRPPGGLRATARREPPFRRRGLDRRYQLVSLLSRPRAISTALR